MCVFASTRNDNGSCQLIYSAICEIEGACAHERQKKTAERCQRDKRKKYELDTQQKYCPIMKHLSGPNDNACVIKWDYIRIRNASLCNVNDIRLTKHSSTRKFWLTSEKLWQNGKTSTANRWNVRERSKATAISQICKATQHHGRPGKRECCEKSTINRV